VKSDDLFVLEVKRDNTKVVLTIPCHDKYEAMSLYDRIVEEAEKGSINLSLTAKRKET
jgi:hypothetical protein